MRPMIFLFGAPARIGYSCRRLTFKVRLMRLFATFVLVVGLYSFSAAVLRGNEECAQNYQMNARCGVCGRDECGCDARKCAPPCKSPPPQQSLAPPQQQGVFVAPPQNGTVLGPANSVHLQGMEIELPALRLRMPSIRLPSAFRSRTNSRMLINEAEAPFVQPNAMPAMAMPVATVPQNQQNISPELLQQLLKQLDAQQQQQPQQQQQQCPQQSPAPCDAASLHKLQQLEESERRLRAKIAQLETSLQDLADQTDRSMSERMRLQPQERPQLGNLQRIPAATERLPPPGEFQPEVQQTVYQRPMLKRLPQVNSLREPRRLPAAAN